MRALIVEDGLSRQALGAARALRSAGWQVGIGSPRARASAAAASRAVSAWHRVPAPEEDLAGFVSAVRTAVDRGGYELVFGARDLDVAALSAFRDSFEAIVPYPPHPAVLRSLDKLELTRLAAGAGFAIPRTRGLDSGAGEIVPPAIVKPRVAAALDRGLAGGRLPHRVSARRVADQSELEQAARSILAAGDDPFVQEVVEGELIALATLVGPDSTLLAACQQRAERTWPPSSGISARARTTPLEPELSDRAAELLRALEWSGIAQIQLLRPPSGDPVLIDFNGRFYGSIALVCAAGLNLPGAWATLARGGEPELGSARVGVRYQWLWGDLRRALVERRGGLLRDLSETLAYAPRATHSVISARDPHPALRYVSVRLRRGARRAVSAGESRGAAA